MTLRTFLFDLDGTLADTAPDLAAALNRTLIHAGRPPLPDALIRPQVSHGATALLQLGFGSALPADELQALRKYLLASYQQNIAEHTVLFPGMPELLQAIVEAGCNWGVVTNKPGWLTAPLMAALELDRQAVTVISGDTLPQCKPHPAPLWQASREAGSQPQECLYVGDAERDIIAGRSAGMSTVVALYGYLGQSDTPERWGADRMIEHPLELLVQIVSQTI